MEEEKKIEANFDILPWHIEYLRPLMPKVGCDIDVLIQGNLNDFVDALDDLMMYYLVDDDARFEAPFTMLEKIKEWIYANQTRWYVTY